MCARVCDNAIGKRTTATGEKPAVYSHAGYALVWAASIRGPGGIRGVRREGWKKINVREERGVAIMLLYVCMYIYAALYTR